MEKVNQTSGNTKMIAIIFPILAFVGTILYFNGGGVERGVASGEIKQYEMCLRNNDYIGASTHAGIASAAFKQAGDENSYRKWKNIADENMEKYTKSEMSKYK